ncbi:MAG: tetratricopeptide repeat protein [Planctomycetes bacterium]|nr:tetratricopeptide repeat protein [Planctomycetota bacterium]
MGAVAVYGSGALSSPPNGSTPSAIDAPAGPHNYASQGSPEPNPPSEAWDVARPSGLAPYVGRFRENGRLLAALHAIDAARSRAVEVLRDRLGIEPPGAEDIVVEFRDALDLSKERLAPVTGDRFAMRLDRKHDRPQAVITVMAEYVVAGVVNLDREILHETVHAAFALRLGDGFARLPPWIREGIALWTAGQGPERVRYYLAHRDALDDGGVLINGLDGPHGLRDYPEDFLAFEYIETRHGADAVRRFVALILGGRPWTAALAEATGEDWPAFQAAARVHARAALDRLADPGLADYRRIAKLGDEPFAVDRAQPLPDAASAFRESHAGSAHTRAALFFEGKALRALGRADEARAAFERVAEAAGEDCGFEDDALVHLGELHEAAGRWPEAAEAFARTVSEHPDSGRLATALYRWGLALHHAGRTTEARGVLEQAVATFPQDPLAREARRTLGR